MSYRARLADSLLTICAVTTLACGSSKPPTAPAPTVGSVTVGVSGSGSSQLAPGESRQLFASAVKSDGSTLDVTNLSTWQSSNPGLATVSGSGLVTAAADGAVDISATYQAVRGSLRTEVRSCQLTLSPSTAAFTAFGGTQTVDVTATTSECRWSARSDAPWFAYVFESPRAGSGSFSYALPPNSTTDVRAATIVVSPTTGTPVHHTISEGRPAGCSYVTRPEELTFTAAGGSGTFDVIATPNDCRWNASSTLGSLGVFITNGFSGTGNGRVSYSVQAHVRPVDVDGYIEISGLSGLNPPGRHHVIVLKR